MKKSLVITTIATVLVIVVALTTATFAWFSTSSAANIDNTFAVAASGSGADIYRWSRKDNNYEGVATTTWELGSYNTDFEWTSPGNAITGTAGNVMGYNPLMPQAILSNAVDGSTGLPSVNFVYASNQQNTTNNPASIASDADSKLHPIAVRFLLVPTYDSTTVTITAMVEIDDPTVRANIDAAKAFRFAIIGTPSSAASATNQAFTFATNYKYLTNGFTFDTGAEPDNTIDTSDYSDSGYVSTDAGAAATATSIVSVASYSTMSSTTTQLEQTISFQATSASQYDCVMYIWFDGSVVTNSTSNGSVSFTLGFKGENNNG